MKTIEESVVMAMDGSDKEIFPYLPFIVQDLWEIGTDPGAIIRLISKHFGNCDGFRVLDLGCGKGAVSIKVAEKLGCYCFGIDAIPEFISFAKNKANEFKVGHLCEFEVGDIREKIKTLPTTYDIIVLGAIGPVFGDYYSTLTTLSKFLNESGIIIVDDGYIVDDSNYSHPLVQKKETIVQQIDSAGMRLLEVAIIPKDDLKDSDDYIFENIKKRCNELIHKYPDKQKLFSDYIEKQEEETDVLENKIVCSIMVIARK
jgi:cyclopropane fatty-acyl-phospholipid synthase-like methyltransferase